MIAKGFKARLAGIALGASCIAIAAPALAAPMALLDRNGSRVAIEPYAPNIVRVTIAMDPDLAQAAPGEGPNAKADASGWTHSSDATGDIFTSSAISLTIDAQPWPGAPTQMQRYFAPALPPVSLSVKDASGTVLTKMTGWEMAPVTVNGEKTFKVGASFDAPLDEHYYGLGQNQEGYMDLRGKQIDCSHSYDAPAGETVCVPFLVTNKGYGIVWDNPARTLVWPGLHNSTRFQSQVGERVSFFVITGKTTDDLYAGYAKLTGATPLPPKAGFGLIQSKARYESQKELLDVANGYRQRNLPLDIMVLDWFYWTRMGQLDIDRTYYPDPKGMNDQLNAMGMRSIISVWPRFEREGRYFEYLKSKGWFLKDKDGNPVDGLPMRSDRAGALIDSTNPQAREWFWGKLRDNIASQGFDWFWLDETEPDLVPDGYFYSIGSGDRYHNLFPLVHTSGVAEGSERDRPNFRNMILARAAYLGSQRNGGLFWSSDIKSTWEALDRQVPAGLNFTASGLAYWGSDIGGWQWPSGPKAQHPVLLDPAGMTAAGADYTDYPELFVRWFQYSVFTPTLRIHGQRPDTELWTYGKAAEPILADWLRLRYTLIPYIYALGRHTYDTGAPFMRGLFMDFPNDPKVSAIGDQYMFGPAFLVAPVTKQGQTKRSVYLPAGTAWYDYWTNQKYEGGQTIEVDAPINRMPLFVKAGSIVPMGVQVKSTAEKQALESIRVYPGADARFTLYDDDGTTNAYRKGGMKAELVWDDKAKTLTSKTKLPTGQAISGLVQIVGQ
ncbi:glycoside hydrolase family 31 protein [Sphingobium yanoikuyae]|jgi:alpha-D-xyloside xylohydrolase|uniref:Glycoside hydrolase family 31 protein n=1 Tax=Sphingobium yanoikuyae TaxID=13690 RepID=A0AA43B873_SPHYA|nr:MULTISPECIES: glycoside hydrolase family 31 protein [Sphingobium]MDH2132046.1 glycoside hydrolase family 31 protein [Sphingobium yanoikuyae]MDH2148403.1 glycoside hydrolase family 31 protein [Sphingobium yanoikuyae]MDH2166296.1 glycoside hydrolase family 31 protein [Sphingobium yanoikuyae]PZU65837.1 MAG: alpha-glucosidase [Sphingobium sp.]